MKSHLWHAYDSRDSSLLRLIHLAGFCAALIGMLVAGFYLVEFASAASLAGGLFIASLASLAGVLLRRRTPLQALVLTLFGGLTLLAIGIHRFYGEIWSIDRLCGALSMVAGQVLLLSAAIRSPLTQLPARYLLTLTTAFVLLISFIAPFSALPNPLGIYFLIAGGYRYDPRTPFYNVFAASLDGDPIPLVTARLDALVGKTGLDPLDPQHALTSYHVRGITSGANRSSPAVDVDLYYSEGAPRNVRIPVIDWRSWQQTGIDRITTKHRPLPGLQLPDDSAPFQLGKPDRLLLHDQSRALVTRWFLPVRADQFKIAPNGDALLVLAEPDPSRSSASGLSLWHVTLDGIAPRLLADNVAATAWTDSGRYALSLTWADGWSFDLTGYDIAAGSAFPLGNVDYPTLSVIGDHVYTVRNGMLWQSDLNNRTTIAVTSLPDANPRDMPGSFAVDPNETRVVYMCQPDLCLADIPAVSYRRIPLNVEPAIIANPNENIPQPAPTALPFGRERPTLASLSLTWSPDGERFAVVTTATDVRGRPELRILKRDGTLSESIALGPDGDADTPQWTPDGQSLFLTLYPSGGRRIVVIDIARHTVYDLSQPHWDAVARLSPDGRYLIVSNGNGGLWRVAVQ